MNRIHQDELLDFVFFLLNVQLSRTVIAMMKVSGRWEASFSSVDLGILCEYSLHLQNMCFLPPEQETSLHWGCLILGGLGFVLKDYKCFRV